MEKQRWADCVRQYSVARVIYAALEKQSSRQTLRDLLYSTVDPSIRYAAYQLKLPRTTAVPSIAAEYFPADSEARAEVESIQVAGLKETDGMEVDSVAPEDLPRTISWRSRTVPLEDASISQALAAAHTAESELSSWLSSPEGQSAAPKDTAAQYDNVIIASQDAVDATKTAIDELLGEGVDQSDKRMQALQVTRTAVNYALVGWRVGRNRVLCGVADGLELDGRRAEEEGSAQAPLVGNEQSTGKRLTQLRERVVLYDSILQSLDSVQELPGVAGDARFMTELDGKQRYFRSLRFVMSGYHLILGR
jgi:signal recognition particle subunit SRP68